MRIRGSRSSLALQGIQDQPGLESSLIKNLKELNKVSRSQDWKTVSWLSAHSAFYRTQFGIHPLWAADYCLLPQQGDLTPSCGPRRHLTSHIHGPPLRYTHLLPAPPPQRKNKNKRNFKESLRISGKKYGNCPHSQHIFSMLPHP